MIFINSIIKKYGEIVKSELPSEETETDGLTEAELEATGPLVLDLLVKAEGDTLTLPLIV
jgi:hypothetical protein